MSFIQVIPHQARWAAEYAHHADILHTQLAAPYITRIDHIGSTSVPGLSAKDIIDIQIAVPTLTEEFVGEMARFGYQHQ